ncbi:hypothetical protein Anas_12034 [Armadillidium nasatum]|uniref:Uncharacterized protein n=1 Tax=Armadillidium nasatum TaxID=96803 RepID=A0A5N5T654_9CRUS|nr:hypothetical protein Anas_12034 [Armadillidium nasatum]
MFTCMIFKIFKSSNITHKLYYSNIDHRIWFHTIGRIREMVLEIRQHPIERCKRRYIITTIVFICGLGSSLEKHGCRAGGFLPVPTVDPASGFRLPTSGSRFHPKEQMGFLNHTSYATTDWCKNKQGHLYCCNDIYP